MTVPPETERAINVLLEELPRVLDEEFFVEVSERDANDSTVSWG